MTVIATSGIWRLEINDADFESDGSATVHGFVDGKPRSWDVKKRLGRLEGADYDPDEDFLMTWPTPDYEDNPELNLPNREEVLGLKVSEPGG